MAFTTIIVFWYSWPIFAAQTTLLHLSVNSTMCLPNSAGELANPVSPELGNPQLDSGINKTSVDCLVELFDNVRGRVPRGERS